MPGWVFRSVESLLSVTVSGCTVWLHPTLLVQRIVWCPPTQVQACPLILRSAVSLRHDKGQTETWPGHADQRRGGPVSSAGTVASVVFHGTGPREVGHRRCFLYVGCEMYCMGTNVWKTNKQKKPFLVIETACEEIPLTVLFLTRINVVRYHC